MSESIKSYPLRLPPSLREGAEKLAKKDGTSLNHLISIAIAEKVAKMSSKPKISSKLH